MGCSSLWGLPAGAGRTMTCMVTTVSAFSSPIDGRKSACNNSLALYHLKENHHVAAVPDCKAAQSEQATVGEATGGNVQHHREHATPIFSSAFSLSNREGMLVVRGWRTIQGFRII